MEQKTTKPQAYMKHLGNLTKFKVISIIQVVIILICTFVILWIENTANSDKLPTPLSYSERKHSEKIENSNLYHKELKKRKANLTWWTGKEESLEKENIDGNLMKRRRAVFQKGCDRWKSTIEMRTDAQSTYFIYLWRAHSWGFCNVPKSGSTSVTKIIGAIQSKETGNPAYLEDRLFFLNESRASLDEIKDMAINGYKNSFVIVRHPFRRVISAFRAIVRYGGGLKYIKKVGQNSKSRDDLLKFRTQVPEDPDYAGIPTFKEFVLFLTQMPALRFNPHYRPAYLLCIPCYINYTVIMHIEDLKDEIHYLADETEVKEISYRKENKFRRLHKDEELALNGEYDTIKLEKFYFSKLSKELFDELYKVYQPDFDLFDYTIPPFDMYIQN